MLERLSRDKWPGRFVLRGYGIPIVGLALATCLSLLLRPYFGVHSGTTIIYLVAVLASAWFGGYGPGVLACLLGLFVIPYFFMPGFDPLKVDRIRAALVLFVSLLISRTADVQKKNERELEKANEQLQDSYRLLDARVQERTVELQRANSQLQRMNTALNEFAHSASHDLQQPLRNLSLYCQLLKRKYTGKLDEEANHCIDTIATSAQQMRTLLTDLLAYSRSINLVPSEAEVVDVKSVLLDALANLRAEIEECRAEIVIGDLPQTRMHRFHLLQLFQNLVGNAIKYRGAEPPRVEIRSFRNGRVGISIADNGIGIAPEYSKQIFGLFKRLHHASEIEGTGVGLAICEAIAERYGGRIWVESRKPRGSIFKFTIPRLDEISSRRENTESHPVEL